MAFWEYYKDNLNHIRHLGAEFAAEFPKIASRLDLSSFDCADPYVERLLEGTAFLAARVEQKMESGYPRLLESILSSVAPLALMNQPSYCVLNLQQKKQEVRLSAGTPFRTKIPGVKTPCTFTPVMDVHDSGITVEDIKFSSRDLPGFSFSELGGQSVAALTLEKGDGIPDEMDLYIDLPDGAASRLMECFTIGLLGIYICDGNGQALDLSSQIKVSLPMFERSSAADRKGIPAGLTDLQQFLTYPAWFKFLRLSGLQEYFKHSDQTPGPLYFVFSGREDFSQYALSSDCFKTGCFPAVNLFQMHSDRIQLSGQYEYQVVPDRTVPLDYEVYQIISAEAIDASNQTLFHFRNKADVNYDNIQKSRSCFVTHRQERLVPKFHQARSSYHGTEVFISFEGEEWGAHQDEVTQIQIELLCTNRELPLLLRKENVFSAENEGNLTAKIVSMPSRPGLPLISSGRQKDWKTAGFLLFNVSSSLWQPGDFPLETISSLIRAYSTLRKEETEHFVEGLQSIITLPHKFRFVEQGCIFYERGWNVEITLHEPSYEGGVLFFAMILRNLLRNFLPMNTCMQLTVISDQRGELVSWQM